MARRRNQQLAQSNVPPLVFNTTGGPVLGIVGLTGGEQQVKPAVGQQVPPMGREDNYKIEHGANLAGAARHSTYGAPKSREPTAPPHNEDWPFRPHRRLRVRYSVMTPTSFQ